MLVCWEKCSSMVNGQFVAWRPNLVVLKINEVLQAESNTLAIFNPIGRCVDEAGGIWNALKEPKSELWEALNTEKWAVRSTIYGPFIILEKHYWEHRMTNRSMTANTKSEYDEAFVDLTNIIEVKPSKSDFLRGFIKFWNGIISVVHSNLVRLQKLI